jgi:PIN domain nuclease of toxin-antitoxin system
MSVAVTDAHALVWYAIGPRRKLGPRARALFERAERGQAAIYVPVLVLVEVAEAMRRGAIRAEGGFSRWIEGLAASGNFPVADLTAAIVREAEALYMIPERGDRLIAATASHLGHPLVTRDPELQRVPGLGTVW